MSVGPLALGYSLHLLTTSFCVLLRSTEPSAFTQIFCGHTPRRTDEKLMYQVSDTRLFFTLSNRQRPRLHYKANIGLNFMGRRRSLEILLRLTIATLMLDIETKWMLNA